MERKKVLVVEDELIISKSICLSLEKKGFDCYAVDSGEKAIAMMKDYTPDVILMDIGLNGKLDSISTAGIIRKQSNKPIIFITDLDNDSVFQQAKGTFPNNYINKPYTDLMLLQAIEIAMEQPMHTQSRMQMPLGERVSDGIFVLSGNEYKKVFFIDILYLKASGVFTLMQCSAGKCFKISLSSNNVAMQLDYPGIVKASRSYYVNIHRIDSIRNNELLVGNKIVPMSKSYKANVLDRVTKISQK